MARAWLPMVVVFAGASAAAALVLSAGVDGGAVSTRIAVVAGDAPSGIASSAIDDASAERSQGAACSTLTSSAGRTDPAPGTPGCGPTSHVTLQDRVWFGTYWQLLGDSLALGGGYVGARIERSADGNFFAGVVEKVDAAGHVSDVVLAFAGAQGGLDVVQGEAVLAGVPLDEATRAANTYEGLLNDPRYADARIHVTGHSLGAGYTQYVLAYALATHGVAATDARADFVAFGAPNWLASTAAHFGVDRTLAAARMVDFTAANDPVLLNGVVRLGINNYLPPFHGLPGLGIAFEPIAAHYPTTYAAALGLPDWLSATERAAATATLSAGFQTGDSISPGYGPPGGLALTVDGSAGAEWLAGLGGDDRLIGREGADVLTGGRGADAFVFTRRSDSGTTAATEDLVTDFSQREGDRIDLSALASLGPLTFVGEAAAGGPGQVRFRYDGGETLVEVRLAASSAPDMVIRLSGRIPLVARDFRLSAL